MEIFIHFTNENFYKLLLILICFNHMYLVQYSPDWSVSSNTPKKQINEYLFRGIHTYVTK